MSSLSLKYQAVASIQRSYRVLTTEQDLLPRNPLVTDALTQLVRTLTACLSPEVAAYLMTAPELTREREGLPALCGMAECEMEKFWARHFLSAPDCDLREFWYLQEYRELCLAEHALFRERGPYAHISFLGAGALPLTAILLADLCPQATITCVDFDAEACALSAALVERLGLQDRIGVLQMDALDYRPQENELVICASLLQGRAQVYRNLEAMDCALLVRDAESVYQYLYKSAELPQPRFHEVARTAVDPKRINTSRYYERDRSAMRHAA